MKNCTFYRETKNLIQEIERQLRRMRKTLRFCQTCPEAGDCPAYQNLEQTVSAALDELSAEMDGKA